MPSVCELHGDLEPCPEVVTAVGTKDPEKFPVPSFIKISKSKIPGAGFGIFAATFIKPGIIIGKYIVQYVPLVLSVPSRLLLVPLILTVYSFHIFYRRVQG